MEKGKIKILPTALLTLFILGVIFWFIKPTNSIRCQKKTSYLGLHGKVKSFCEKSFVPIKRGNKWIEGAEKELVLAPCFYFDDDGRVIVEKLGGNPDKEYEYRGGEPYSLVYISYKKERINGEYRCLNSNSVEKIVKHNGITEKVIEHFKNGIIIKKELTEFTNNGSINIKYVIDNTYDSNNRLTSQKVHTLMPLSHKSELVHRFKYLEEDSYGNWTKRLFFYNDFVEPKFINVRQIEYR